MDVGKLLTKVSDDLSVRRAFGTAYEKDDMLIIPVALVLGGLLLLLWRAVVRGRRWLVWTIFVLAAYPAVMLAAQFVYEHFFHTPG